MLSVQTLPQLSEAKAEASGGYHIQSAYAQSEPRERCDRLQRPSKSINQGLEQWDMSRHSDVTENESSEDQLWLAKCRERHQGVLIMIIGHNQGTDYTIFSSQTAVQRSIRQSFSTAFMVQW
jgi:hypothetical protein